MDDNNQNKNASTTTDPKPLPQLLRLRLTQDRVVQVCGIDERVHESIPLVRLKELIYAPNVVQKLEKDAVADVWPTSRLEQLLLHRIAIKAVHPAARKE
jgi:hypothetical protein